LSQSADSGREIASYPEPVNAGCPAANNERPLTAVYHEFIAAWYHDSAACYGRRWWKDSVEGAGRTVAAKSKIRLRKKA